jgi:1,4-dihydroxy-2-naphthoate octaprenyltransferase
MIRKKSQQAWWLAARPKTLPAAVAPVVVACALAVRDGVFQWLPAGICLLFAVLLQVAANFANDYFDYRKGSDTDERQGPPRAVAQGWIAPQAMLRATFGVVVVAGLVGLPLIGYGGWPMLLVGLVIAVFALAYSGGPYPLAYHGWGDVCVLVFFGIVPVGFTYYVQALQWPTTVGICGMAVGLVVVNILVANNFRDRRSDRKVGKKTSIVLFGSRFGKDFYLANGILAVACCQYFWWEDAATAALLPFAYLYFHLRTWRKMVAIGHGPALIGVLEQTARNVLVFAGLLGLGLILSEL